MTTTTASEFAPAGPVGRVINVVRLHLANPWTTILLPWMILGFIFLVNLAIWWIILTAAGPDARNDVVDGLQYSGASSFIFVYMMIVAIGAINLTFPFALGYGVTRRDFWLGSSLAFVLLSAMYSLGLTLLSVIEQATGGWGLGGRMFTAIYFGETWYERLFIFFSLMMFFFFFGAAIATVYVRWKANGVTLFFAVVGVLLVAAAAILTFTSNWGLVGNFFVGAGLVGSFAWSYVITVASGILGFFILRRATPKS